MKMVKSLLLGSAAGLVAVAGAQAADLPVKAKPVQYVKICSLYGAGFYYIPGTDMCLKMGGWVRAEASWQNNGSSVLVYQGDVNNRSTNNMWWRIRGYITADARNQSEYGTIRSYIAVGLSTNTTGLDNAANQFDANKAFIQFAGFTFGRATSFYDFFSGAFNSYFGFYPQSDTGDGGQNVMTYTAQFGGGWSASLGVESRRMTQIVNQDTVLAAAANATGNLGAGGFSTTGLTVSGAGTYGGWQVPDIVGNIRVDQPWGSAQVMGALHQVNANYYNLNVNAAGSTTGLVQTNEITGNPSNAWGYAVGAGLKINTPYIGAGDYIWGQINYSRGALRYLFQNPNGNYWLSHGQSVAYGVLADGVYGGAIGNGTATSVELTTAWGFNLAYEHFWSKAWRTSVHGGYYAVSYDGAANNMLCSAQNTLSGTLPGFSIPAARQPGNGLKGSAALATAGCDNNFSTWWIGSRTQWNISPDTYLGLDVAYAKINSMSTPSGYLTSGSGATSSYPISLGNQDNWQARFRVHRDFYP